MLQEPPKVRLRSSMCKSQLTPCKNLLKLDTNIALLFLFRSCLLAFPWILGRKFSCLIYLKPNSHRH